MTLGEQIADARHDARLTQRELGDLIGVATNTVAAYENDRQKPRQDKITRLEEHLGRQFNTTEDPVTPPEGQPPLDGFSKDEPPKPRKPAAKKAAPKAATGMPSLQVQLRMPYELAAGFLQTRLPTTAGVLHQQAGPCAAAWDQFLLRYPKLREKIEQGAVAADIVNLVMAHVPIVQTAQQELQFLQRVEAERQGYTGGLDTAA